MGLNKASVLLSSLGLLQPVLGAVSNSFISSFSCAISSVTLNAGDEPLNVCNQTTDSGSGVISLVN